MTLSEKHKLFNFLSDKRLCQEGGELGQDASASIEGFQEEGGRGGLGASMTAF